MTSGIALQDLRPVRGARSHVHTACDDWVITSEVPPDAALADCALVEHALPGALGCHFLPADAVLHFVERTATRAAFEALVQRERLQVRARTLALNAQLTATPGDALCVEEEAPTDCESDLDDCEEDDASGDESVVLEEEDDPEGEFTTDLAAEGFEVGGAEEE